MHAARKPEAHLNLAIDILARDLHVARIHGLHIQFRQSLNRPDKLRCIASQHVRPAYVSVREHGVAGEERQLTLFIQAQAAQRMAGRLHDLQLPFSDIQDHAFLKDLVHLVFRGLLAKEIGH